MSKLDRIVNIAANAIATSRGDINQVARTLVWNIMDALTDDAIVTQAAEALRDDADEHGVPAAVRHLDADTRRRIARAVLRSVGV